METMATAWRRSHTLRDEHALRSWLLTIAARKALSFRRKRRTVLPLESGLAVVGSERGVELEDQIAVREAMAELPPRMRAAIALHYFADLTVAETANVLGKSQNTIKTQLQGGISRLRVALEAPRPSLQGEPTNAE